MGFKCPSMGCVICIILLVIVLQTFAPFPACADTPGPINAFFLNDVPSQYEDIERLFRALKLGGANTVILSPPSDLGIIDKNMLTNEVFIAHQAGLKIFIVLPTRGNKQILEKHPEWEDYRYDQRTGTLQRTGRIDLFSRAAIDLLAASIMEVAAYSIDGILLGDDFYYGETEGMSPLALKTFKRSFGKEFTVREVFGKTAGNGHVLHGDNAGNAFWTWTDLKKNMLVNLYRAVAKAAWSVNSRVKLGIPLHLDGNGSAVDELAHFGYDISQLKKMEIDYYWLAVRQRDTRAQYNLSYSKSMEALSRIVSMAITLVDDPAKTIIAIQTTDRSGRLLPSTEIEEATEMVMHQDKTGIAFMVTASMPVSSKLTAKIFKR